MNDHDDTPLFPIAFTAEEGEKYFWCGCGQSQTEPFCDKTGCGDNAVEWVADLTEEVYLCHCKHTQNPPWCDGSHAKVLMEKIKSKT